MWEARAGRPLLLLPHAFSGAKDYLYRNLGAGKFADVSQQTGVARAGRFDGKGLGVVLSDLDLDGDLDIVVANDSCANFLYRNDGNWHFEEVAAIAGVAFAEDGRERAGMGIDSADCDGDGLPDILICNLNAEPNSFFRNRGKLVFEDQSGASGLGPPSVPFVGFGCGLVDFDGDGDLDALVANGHILDNAELFGDASPYRERPLLFENSGRARFKLIAATQPFLATPASCAGSRSRISTATATPTRSRRRAKGPRSAPQSEQPDQSPDHPAPRRESLEPRRDRRPSRLVVGWSRPHLGGPDRPFLFIRIVGRPQPRPRRRRVDRASRDPLAVGKSDRIEGLGRRVHLASRGSKPREKVGKYRGTSIAQSRTAEPPG